MLPRLDWQILRRAWVLDFFFQPICFLNKPQETFILQLSFTNVERKLRKLDVRSVEHFFYRMNAHTGDGIYVFKIK